MLNTAAFPVVISGTVCCEGRFVAYQVLVTTQRPCSQPSSFLSESPKFESSSSKRQCKQETGVKKPKQSLFLPFKGKSYFPCTANFSDLLKILWRPFQDKNKSFQSLGLWHNFRKSAQTKIANESPFLHIKPSRPDPGLCVVLIHERVKTR